MIRALVCIVLVASILLGIDLARHRMDVNAAVKVVEAAETAQQKPVDPPRFDAFLVAGRAYLIVDHVTGREFLVSYDGGIIEIGPKR